MSEAAPLARLLGLAAPPPPPPSEEAMEAYANGFADGMAEAEARHAADRAADHAAREDALERALAAAEAARDALVGEAADCLAEAGLAIAAAIIGARPAIPTETLRGLVAEALAAAPAEGGGVVHLPAGLPADLGPLLPDGWTVSVEPALAHGSVRAELADRAILASLEARLADLARLLAERA